MIEGRNKFARITCRACGAMCPEENWNRRAALAAQPADIVNPISQQEPVAWRHSKTGRLYDSVEEVPLADGDEWAEPLYAAPATQQAPAAWRQWSSKLHDWDYQTNRGDLRPDTPADPLFVAAAQPATTAVPPCHVAVIGHRFDPVNQTHVPQVLLEFEPVPVNSPNDAKGWQDRDALAAMIAAAGDKP